MPLKGRFVDRLGQNVRMLIVAARVDDISIVLLHSVPDEVVLHVDVCGSLVV